MFSSTRRHASEHVRYAFSIIIIIIKSPGNEQIQNYWLKAFPATHRHITKNFNAIIEEPEKAPDWLITGVTYLIPKSGDSKEVRKY